MRLEIVQTVGAVATETGPVAMLAAVGVSAHRSVRRLHFPFGVRGVGHPAFRRRTQTLAWHPCGAPGMRERNSEQDCQQRISPEVTHNTGTGYREQSRVL